MWSCECGAGSQQCACMQCALQASVLLCLQDGKWAACCDVRETYIYPAARAVEEETFEASFSKPNICVGGRSLSRAPSERLVSGNPISLSRLVVDLNAASVELSLDLVARSAVGTQIGDGKVARLDILDPVGEVGVA